MDGERGGGGNGGTGDGDGGIGTGRGETVGGNLLRSPEVKMDLKALEALVGSVRFGSVRFRSVDDR